MVKDNLNSVDLKGVFYNLQKQMRLVLESNAAYMPHSTTHGDSTELNWIGLLEKYLPVRYQVKKAQVLDSTGRLSEQIDMVILDRQYSPILFNQGAALYVPAESVYAVVEIKPKLNKSTFNAATKKARSVRNLHRTSAPIYDFRGKGVAKIPEHILAGIVALSSEWTPPFGKSFKRAIEEQEPMSRLDFGCVLNEGAFAVTYDKSRTAVINSSKKRDALIRFFFTMLSCLQKMGTAPAIEYDKYSLSLIEV